MGWGNGIQSWFSGKLPTEWKDTNIGDTYLFFHLNHGEMGGNCSIAKEKMGGHIQKPFFSMWGSHPPPIIGLWEDGWRWITTCNDNWGCNFYRSLDLMQVSLGVDPRWVKRVRKRRRGVQLLVCGLFFCCFLCVLRGDNDRSGYFFEFSFFK